jgi:hypothetical protein
MGIALGIVKEIHSGFISRSHAFPGGVFTDLLTKSDPGTKR